MGYTVYRLDLFIHKDTRRSRLVNDKRPPCHHVMTSRRRGPTAPVRSYFLQPQRWFTQACALATIDSRISLADAERLTELRNAFSDVALFTIFIISPLLTGFIQVRIIVCHLLLEDNLFLHPNAT